MSLAEEIQQQILDTLYEGPISDTSLLTVDGVHPDAQVILGVLKRLEAHSMVTFTPHERDVWVLTEEGASIASSGSHEAKVFASVSSTGTPLKDVFDLLGEGIGRIGLGKAFANRWVAQKDSETVVRTVEFIEDQTQKDLLVISSGILGDRPVCN